ncbi:MAG: FKBP-type peptidyl-prolyl cis-trans isomerase [Bacteroidota bacterium]
MKFYLGLGISLVLLAMGCSNQTCAEEAGLISLDQYIADNNLTVIEGEAGLRYIITEPGGVDRPAARDEVVVRYAGRQTNDVVFDQTLGDPRSFCLNSLIPGWQLGIPLVGAGGKVTLFLPSDLGYGPSGSGQICPNAGLIFDIELISFDSSTRCIS